jgi:PQQ-dependent catabolism-associated beta-propeller protein
MHKHIKKFNYCSIFTAAFFAYSNLCAQPFAYVSSEKDNNIAVINLRDMKVQTSFAACKRPRHLQLTATQQLMVACSNDQAVSVFDLKSQKAVNRIPLGEDPEMFDLSPDGKTLFVSDEEEAELSIVDIASKSKKIAIKVGKEPEGVKVSPDGKTVYVTSEVASMVHVIDVASQKITKNIPVGKRPRRFAISPDGKELWVTNELSASVSIISTQDYKVLDTINFELKGARSTDITPVGIVMTKNGKRVYVSLGRANHVAFVDTASRKVTHNVLAGKRAWGLALNKDESQLLVVNGLSDDLTVVDTNTAKAIITLPVGRVPHSVVIAD